VGMCARHELEAALEVIEQLGLRTLAYFGYPQAHEDDAEQALRAGWSKGGPMPAERGGSDALVAGRTNRGTRPPLR
jgi:hypothetical protein